LGTNYASVSICSARPVAVIGFASIASAADLPRKAPAYAPPPPQSTVGRFYVGGNMGYSWRKVDTTANESGLTLVCRRPLRIRSSRMASFGRRPDRLQLASLTQLGVWHEADFQGSGQKHSNSFSIPFLVSGPLLGRVSREHHYQRHINDFSRGKVGVVRHGAGRIGYAWDNVMVYATGGLAYGHVESALASTATFSIPPVPPAVVSFNDSKTKAGWTVGGRHRRRIFNTRNWTWKVEYSTSISAR